MGPIGVQEMLMIFLIALLLFGPKKLPELGRTLGKALSEFRRAKNELKNTFESHLHELERETQLTTTSNSNSSTSTPNYSSTYTYPYEDYNQYDPSSHTDSAPAQISSTEQNAAALPSAPNEQEQAEHKAAAPESLPALPYVSGTVARSNGVRPLDETREQGQDSRPESVREEHPV